MAINSLALLHPDLETRNAKDRRALLDLDSTPTARARIVRRHDVRTKWERDRERRTLACR
jgi:hypothetical protein